MKKIIVLAAAACALAANAQQTVEHTNFGSNWSIGLTGGVVTPLTHHAFFGDMKGTFGLDIHKQISYVFGVGVEGTAAINTTEWGHDGYRSNTAIDQLYVGAYGSINLANLFLGYSCEPRKFGLDAILGAGWGHNFWAKSQQPDWNYFATKVGLNINYNVTPAFTLSLRPAIIWNMTDNDIAQTSAGYNANNATFACSVGLTYNFGKGFPCASCAPDNSAELAALNSQLNEALAAAAAATALANQNAAKADALAAELAACQNKKPQVIKETTVPTRYVFFQIGKSTITNDQMPNVMMVADYLKSHKDATVVIKGYASKDGNLEFNNKLAAARAESVKNTLIKKYGIAASRINAEGQGIGEMFDEESWNRVAICTLDK